MRSITSEDRLSRSLVDKNRDNKGKPRTCRNQTSSLQTFVRAESQTRFQISALRLFANMLVKTLLLLSKNPPILQKFFRLSDEKPSPKFC